MIYAGIVRDKDTGRGIPFATVSVYSPINQLLARVIANASGEYLIDHPAAVKPNKITFTSAGYKPDTYLLTIFDELDFSPPLEKEVKELDTVTVTSHSQNGMNILLFLIGLAATMSQTKN